MIENRVQTENKLFTEIDTKPKTRVPKKVLDKNDFMLLFIKQLEYQDPLKPLENNEMATQLALFNQVDQLFDLNEKIKQLIEIAQNDKIQTISELIGKKSLVKSNIGRIEKGKFLGGKVILDEPVNDLKLKVYDSEGNLVRTLDLGALPAGQQEIEWDGKDEKGKILPDGNYYFSIKTSSVEEADLITIKTVGRITGALLEDGQSQLLFNGYKEISISDIEKIIAEEA